LRLSTRETVDAALFKAAELGDLDDLSVITPTLEDAYLQLVAGGAR